MFAHPVGIDNDGNGIWEDDATGERYNSGEPLTEDEARPLLHTLTRFEARAWRRRLAQYQA